MWRTNDKKSVERNSPTDYKGKQCGGISYSTGKLGALIFICAVFGAMQGILL